MTHLRRLRNRGREMRCSTAHVAPLIESATAEEQPASWTVLLRGDRALSRQPPDRVAVKAEILGGAPGVEPFVGLLLGLATKLLRNGGSNSLSQRVQDLLQY